MTARETGALTSTLDLSTRCFWRLVGQPVDIGSEHGWRDSPANARGGIGDQWLDALEATGRVRDCAPDDGLLESMSALDGPDFRSADVDPAVRDFYEHTAARRI